MLLPLLVISPSHVRRHTAGDSPPHSLHFGTCLAFRLSSERRLSPFLPSLACVDEREKSVEFVFASSVVAIITASVARFKNHKNRLLFTTTTAREKNKCMSERFCCGHPPISEPRPLINCYDNTIGEINAVPLRCSTVNGLTLHPAFAAHFISTAAGHLVPDFENSLVPPTDEYFGRLWYERSTYYSSAS